MATVQKQARTELTRGRLIAATERLVAEWGIEAVNLRDVGREADQRNNSVVQYHFGTKELLIDAVLDLRIPQLAERLESALGSASDHKGVATALVSVFTDMTSSEPDVVGFLSGIATSRHWKPVLHDREDFQALMSELASSVKSAGTPSGAAAARARMAFTLAVVTVAGADPGALGTVRSELVEAVTGLLGAGSRQLAGSGRR